MNQNQLREYLFQQDLAHEKQMDRLIKDAQPKKINEDYKIKLMRPPIITRDLIGPEYVAERQLLDLSLDLQMQNTIKQAMYALDGKTPEPMKGSVTEEMIADYKKEVMKPVQIGNKFHLYRPVEIPPLVKPTPTPYNHGGKKISEVTYRRKMQDIFDDISGYEAELDNAHFFKNKLEEEFRLGSTSGYDEPARRGYLQTLSKKELISLLGQKKSTLTEDKLIDKIVASEKVGKTSPADLARIKTELGDINNEIGVIVSNINTSHNEFTTFKAIYEQQDAVDEENRLKEIEFDNKKRQLAQDVLSDFNRLNQGKIEVTRQLNETDDEFIARLQQMGNIFVDPNDMAKQIETENLMKAKKNILELTSDYGKAESVTRMLNYNERFQMNKVFPMMKKKYSETFGLNNNKLDDVEIAQFIKNEFETSQSLTAVPKKAKPEYTKFDKQELLTIVNQLNTENPALNLDSGLKKEEIVDN